jgi:hypothetical protein
VQARCSGQAVPRPVTAGLSGGGYPSFSGGQLVTEGARVDQVGEELSIRAVVRIVMGWLSESNHPLACVSSASVILYQVAVPGKHGQSDWVKV